MKKEKRYIIDTSFNWADEFDRGTFCILSEEDLEGYKKCVELMDDEDTHELYFGTNESREFSRDELLEMLSTAREITPAQEKTLEDLVPYHCFCDPFSEFFCMEEDDDDED